MAVGGCASNEEFFALFYSPVNWLCWPKFVSWLISGAVQVLVAYSRDIWVPFSATLSPILNDFFIFVSFLIPSKQMIGCYFSLPRSPTSISFIVHQSSGVAPFLRHGVTTWQQCLIPTKRHPVIWSVGTNFVESHTTKIDLFWQWRLHIPPNVPTYHTTRRHYPEKQSVGYECIFPLSR